MSYLNGSIHHIGVVFHTEIAVGFNHIYSIGVSDVGYAFFIKTKIIAVFVCIPTDIVGIVGWTVIANLSVFVSKTDKCSCYVIIRKTDSLTYRCYHFVTEFGGVIKSSKTSAARYEVGGKVCARIQGVIYQDTFYIGNFHILADFIYESDKSGMVFTVLRNQGRFILRLEIDIAYDICKSLNQSVAQRALT